MADSDSCTPDVPCCTPAELYEARVEYVADLMRELKFRTGVTSRGLGAIWGLKRWEITKITCEASKRVRSELTDGDRVMSKVSAALDAAIDSAIESGDRHALIKAAQTWATVTGAGAAAKVALTTDLASMTPEQLAERKAEILARLAPPEKKPE